MHKGIVYLYTYPVIFFKLNVSDYPNIVGISLIFYRIALFMDLPEVGGAVRNIREGLFLDNYKKRRSEMLAPLGGQGR